MTQDSVKRVLTFRELVNVDTKNQFELQERILKHQHDILKDHVSIDPKVLRQFTKVYDKKMDEMDKDPSTHTLLNTSRNSDSIRELKESYNNLIKTL
jgi:hypothetical protein